MTKITVNLYHCSAPLIMPITRIWSFAGTCVFACLLTNLLQIPCGTRFTSNMSNACIYVKLSNLEWGLSKSPEYVYDVLDFLIWLGELKVSFEDILWNADFPGITGNHCFFLVQGHFGETHANYNLKQIFLVAFNLIKILVFGSNRKLTLFTRP